MFVCLFEPDIPQNVGSMIRLCACMDVPLHIIEPCGFPMDDKRMRRVAMDYVDLVHITRHRSWAEFMRWKHSMLSARLILLTTRGAETFTRFAFTNNDILLFGRESAGVTDEVRSHADAGVKIPVHTSTRSLNLVQAASMVLGEALRQTHNFPAVSL